MNNEKKEDAIFIGSGWIKYLQTGKHAINCTLNLTELQKNKEHIYEDKDGNKCVRITVGEKKELKTEKSPTHWIKIDTWKPESK